MFLSKHVCKDKCRRCLSSSTSQNVLTKHKQKFEQEITAIETSNESHLHWKKQFHRNPLLFLGYMQILKVIKQLTYINKIQYVMVII